MIWRHRGRGNRPRCRPQAGRSWPCRRLGVGDLKIFCLRRRV